MHILIQLDGGYGLYGLSTVLSALTFVGAGYGLLRMGMDFVQLTVRAAKRNPASPRE